MTVSVCVCVCLCERDEEREGEREREREIWQLVGSGGGSSNVYFQFPPLKRLRGEQ